MADEVTITGKLAFAKGNLDEVSRAFVDKTIDVSGTQHIHHVQSIGTSEEALDMGDLTTPGYAWFRNLDATNYVSVRDSTGANNFLELKAGEWSGPVRLARTATAPFAIADTAAVELEYLIIED